MRPRAAKRHHDARGSRLELAEEEEIMRAHRLRQSAYRVARTSRGGGSSIGHRFARAALLTATLVLSSGTTLAVLPPPAAAEECPNAAFRTGPSTHLPDCR